MSGKKKEKKKKKRRRDNSNMEKKTHDMKINWLIRSRSIGSLLEGKL